MRTGWVFCEKILAKAAINYHRLIPYTLLAYHLHFLPTIYTNCLILSESSNSFLTEFFLNWLCMFCLTFYIPWSTVWWILEELLLLSIRYFYAALCYCLFIPLFYLYGRCCYIFVYQLIMWTSPLFLFLELLFNNIST